MVNIWQTENTMLSESKITELMEKVGLNSRTSTERKTNDHTYKISINLYFSYIDLFLDLL